MSDALRRGLRTFLDVAFVTAVVQALVAFDVDLSADQQSVLVVLGTFLVSAGKNTLEDAGTVPALLKAPASDGANPVPDGGQSVLVVAAVAAVICLVLLFAFDLI